MESRLSSQWPFAADSPLVRARKVAWAYRAALESAADPGVVQDLDERFLGWGERWITPAQSYKPDDLVTAQEAGGLIGVDGGTVSERRLKGHIVGVRDGRRYLYKVADVYALATRVHRRKTSQAVRVPDNGRSVSNG
jgi:hypothetical protein